MPRRSLLRRTLSDPAALVGFLILAAVVLMAALAHVIYPDDPLDMVSAPLVPPLTDPAFPAGTDALGRDLLSGIVHGARVSLMIGFASALLCLLIGAPIGAICGYYGKLADELLSRFTELVQTVPSFLFIIILVTILGPSTWTITISIGAVSWIAIARLTRAEFRSLKERDYVLAARSLGFGDLRIMALEIFPAVLPPLIVTTTLLVATAILEEASLSFLGLGDPNVVSWGSMIGAGREVLRSNPYVILAPGAAILLTLLALNLLSDALTEAINPKKRLA